MWGLTVSFYMSCVCRMCPGVRTPMSMNADMRMCESVSPAHGLVPESLWASV